LTILPLTYNLAVFICYYLYILEKARLAASLRFEGFEDFWTSSFVSAREPGMAELSYHSQSIPTTGDSEDMDQTRGYGRIGRYLENTHLLRGRLPDA
jgi:hypothetical protein